ncbi:MAG TPA: ComEC/Rec2 family competence protein [Ktedonobacterales bacterium]|nr:ComEC/Rec2 family competence protein [Ktedonobacterales bacterium]
MASPAGSAPSGVAAFGGYALVALVGAWLAGIALSAVGPLATLAPLVWLIVAGMAGALAVGLWLAGRRIAGAAGMAPTLVTRTRPTLATRLWRAAPLAALLVVWVALGAARAAWTDPTRDPLTVGRFATGASYQVQGDIVEEPDIRDGFRFLTVQVTQVSGDSGTTWQAAHGRVEATVYGPDDWFAPAYGDNVILTGALKPLGNSYAPAGVVARMSSARASIQARGGGNPLLAWLFALRVTLAQVIQRTLPEPEASLLIGILLGLKSPVLRTRQALFVATGTIHLVVPAGLKVAVLADLAGRAARRLGRWPGAVAALAAIGMYAALGGGGAAAARAAIMGALLALAPALGRNYNVFTALALAVLLMTLVEPLLIYDAGFQLTALATLGLPLLASPIQTRLLALAGPLARLPGARVIAELLAVTMAAQIATAPVLAITFHVVSLIAPIANLLTVPLLAPLLVLGGLLAGLALIGGPIAGALAVALSWVVWPLLWFVDNVINVCASLPFAALTVTGATTAATSLIGPLALAGAYYGALLAAFIGLRRLARRGGWAWASRGASSTAGRASGAPAHGTHTPLSRGLLVGVLALALLGSCGAALPAMAAGGVAHLDILDVGTGGEAILLRLPSGATALIDGGPNGPALEAALAGLLPFWRRRLDMVALTDTRAGNARGLEDAASHFAIGHALDAGMLHPTAEYLAYLDAARHAGASRTQLRANDIAQLDATTTLRALAPPQQLYPPNEGDTTASDDLILRLDTPGLRVLLLGDADAYALDALLGAGASLAADVVTLALPTGAPLDLSGPLGAVLAAAHPRLIVITEAPSTKTVAKKTALEIASDPWANDTDAGQQLGALIYRTSEAGTISLSGGAGGWALA